MSSEQVWAVVGRISTFLVSITALLSIYKFFKLPKGILLAEAEFSKFGLPDSLKSNLDTLFTFIRDTEEWKDDTENVKMISEVRRIFTARGVWYVRIFNKGNISCQSVTIKLPGASMVVLKREGEAECFFDVQDVIKVGSLAPRQEAYVEAWATSSWIRERELRLTHEQGVGKITYRASAGPFWRFLERNWGMLLWGIFIFSLSSAPLVLSLIKRCKSPIS